MYFCGCTFAYEQLMELSPFSSDLALEFQLSFLNDGVCKYIIYFYMVSASFARLLLRWGALGHRGGHLCVSQCLLVLNHTRTCM